VVEARVAWPASRARIEAVYPAPEVAEVPADQVPDDALLLDVREDDEWQTGHATGAVHIPLGEVPLRLHELGDVTEDRPLYVICRSGVRSAGAVAWLAERGVPAVNVGGGTLAWARSRRPMTSENGAPPAVA
jgi:rhodanese-related sulfurtransferase